MGKFVPFTKKNSKATAKPAVKSTGTKKVAMKKVAAKKKKK